MWAEHLAARLLPDNVVAKEFEAQAYQPNCSAPTRRSLLPGVEWLARFSNRGTRRVEGGSG